jgi:serine/threonine protein kinase
MIDSNKVHLEKVIGSGAYGKVWKGTIAGATVAVKEMLKSCNNEMVEKEIQLLAQIRSPYCVRLLGIYYQADKLFIVTEFIQGGDLSDVIHKKTGGSLSETIKLKILLDVARGVAFLHENNIIHRDLKTDNCLIRSLHPEAPQYAVLADFGISKFVVSLGEATDVSHTRAMGTPVYMAPGNH